MSGRGRGRGRGHGTPQRPNGPLRRPNSLPLVLIIHRLKEHLYEAGVPRVPQVSPPFLTPSREESVRSSRTLFRR